MEWNGGDNYFVYEKYMIVWGFVDETSQIPLIDQLQHYETPDIGNIYDSTGALITDDDLLDTICRKAASGFLTLPYSLKYVAIAAFPLLKDGLASGINFGEADYGLDWEWIQVRWPGGMNNNVTDNQIQNAELVLTMQPGAMWLNEMNWDYALESPYIDGFAIIFRAQSYWWSWVLNGAISDSETTLSNIIGVVDPTSGGGQAAWDDFYDRYAEWWDDGITHFYVMISDESQHELIQINAQTQAVTRGVEGTTAKTWAAGAVFSYSPCELIDSVAGITDTKQRSFMFNPPVPLNFALHCVICAVKLVSESPGYIRSNYAFWDVVTIR